ncbi:hypothetical protein F4813DRAFT_342136 [Daldinia decipiens]|uniref:uncharacterized protein n=1 Tax=Daldinia decipiens TaxID=326647 RepID=UPI0020C2812E|nr:uncharacterized protein F4813DRAFT_342136 [Daldinia decipiens]KAI1662847.1 hypothetical protein F4813DRAFT_342136 [Daldinia decipiens]
MELTPIKVRGKRRLGNEAVVAIPKMRSKAVDKSKLHKSQRSRESKASYLEKIPLEILERILWYSENVNLPRSSPLIGRLLSGRSTLRETFIVAFQPTWDAWFGCIGYRHDSTLPAEGNPDFQSGLLEYPWTNISFILESWDFYVQRFAKLEQSETNQPFHLQHIRIWGDPDNPANAMTKDYSNIVDSQKASRCFFHDYAAFRTIEEHIGYYLRTFYTQPINPTFLEVHKDTRIPDSLFTSPYSDDKIQKLFWLVRGGARLSPDQTWELTLQSFRDAVPETLPHVGKVNLTMIRLLYTLGAYQTWPEHVSTDEADRIYSILRKFIGGSTAEIAAKYEYIFRMLYRG